ncbi:FmdB family zinc ribbon protein [Planotetraspora phitsanulokensis]|uniref:Putative regulatory protein FmdB zinc ribbon domain-containing protein n=1 Tax=Planotetraspora phitsanulokensis TaxID=575192 RepID=A0A8J3UBL8_9ACTN|nr:FmdB family zinc ribbon protein [Planotetraspora phitsanulokensis]GII42448.1 hypothetical protein Pph01_74510 [Planotetraspora phitsanulokensis]
MATYEFVCPACGPFDVVLPMGTASSHRECPWCGEGARRVYSTPRLSRLASALAGALAQEERSRDEPEVVSNVPRRGRRR